MTRTSKAAGWRLKNGRYGFPVEQKLFDIYVRATGQTQAAATDYVVAPSGGDFSSSGEFT